MLRGKNAFITGCNRGIGRAILDKLMSYDANIYCAIKKKDADFSEFLEKYNRKSGSRAEIIVLDLSDGDHIKDSIKTLYEKKEKIDILINNAGIADGALFEMTSVKTMKDVFEINFFSQIQLTQLLLRFMKKSESACIINIGSVSGLTPERGTISYGSSKAALMFATKVMANELSRFNIRVNAIAPSLIKTDMLDQMDDKSINKILDQSYSGKIGEAKDIADLVLYLVSDSARLINGQIIRVDGGMRV